MLRTTVLTSALLGAPAALAAPIALTHQGRLLDASGAPLNGSTVLQFDLYDTSSSTSAVFSETATVPVEDGYYAVVLDIGVGGVTLDSAMLADGDSWLQVSVAGAPVGTRTRLAEAPGSAVARSLDLPHVTASTCTTAGAMSWDPTFKVLRTCDGAKWSPAGARVESVQIGVWGNGTPLMVDVLRDGARLRPANGAGFRFTLHHNNIIAGHSTATVWVGIYTHLIVHSTTTTGGNDASGSGMYLIQTRSTGNTIETVNADSYLSISAPGGFAPHYGDRITFSTTTNNETQISLIPTWGHFGDVNGAAMYETF